MNPDPYYTGSDAFSNPQAACEAQRVYYNPNAIGQPAVQIDWRRYGCRWLGKQDGVENANTILPAWVTLYCLTSQNPSVDWVLEAPGICRSDIAREPECECEDTQIASPSAPTVGNPISLQTGSKVEHVLDYATADGLFTVERRYRSRNTVTRAATTRRSASFGNVWRGLLPGLIFAHGDSWELAQYYSDAGALHAFSFGSNGYTVSASSRLRLTFTGAAPANRASYFTAAVSNETAEELRLDFPNGDYVMYRRAPMSGVSSGRHLFPVRHTTAAGYTRHFDYALGATTPYRIRDGFDRIMTLTWSDVTRQSSQPSPPPGTTDTGSYPVISQIGLPDGTTLEYVYDRPQDTVGFDTMPANDRLQRVRRLSAAAAVLSARTYHYENAAWPYALTGISDQNLSRIATFAYDQAGFATLSEHAGGADRVTVDTRRIDDANLARVVTNPLGYVSTWRTANPWQFYLADPLLPNRWGSVDHAATPSIPARQETFENTHFTEGNWAVGYSDARGVFTRRTVDPQGRPSRVIGADGRPEAQTTDTTWHATFDRPLTETRGNLRIEYTYDAQGRTTQRREVDISTHTVPYSTSGLSRTWTYGYSAQGRLLTTNGPRSLTAGKDDSETYVYDAVGNLTSVTNGLGHVTSFATFDANGRPATMTDPNGIITQFVYDALGRMTSMSVRAPGAGTAHATTTFEYDIEGRVVGITRPATARLGMTYNLAGRLLSVSAPTGEAITFTHDAMGNVTRQRVTTAASAQRSDIQRTFDELGRMLTESFGIGRTASFTYDAEGNPTRVTSPRNFATDQAFDGLARLISVVHPDTGAEANAYNQNDDLTSFTDPLSVATQFMYNGFGQAIREVSPDRGTSTYEYSAGGDLIAATDGRGQRVDYTHDILGRVLTRTPLGQLAQRVTYVYDTAGISGSYGKGRLATITDQSGTTKFKYDHRGNVLTRQQVISGSPTITLAVTYDLADRILRITYPSGRWVDYARDTQGRVLTVTTRASGASTTTTLLSAAVYEPFGALTTATYGNTHRFAQIFDDTGRRTHRRWRASNNTTNIWSVAYGYDVDDNINSITDLVDPARDLAFQYDAVDRLSRVDMAAGATRREDYVHDLGGNRVRVERRAAVTDAAPASQDTYARATGTNRLTSMTTPIGTRSFTHDARGNLSGEDRSGTNDVTTGYDGYARLTSYVRTGEANLGMAYNGMDQRVAVTSGGITRRFVQDGDGRMLGEYAANGTQPFAEYIWLLPEVGDAGTFGGDDGTGGWTPLAVSTANGAGGAQTLHWLHSTHLGVPNGSYSATGAATTLTGITLLGFPGQQQTLSDLYYNQHRDYDPSTGRYIQADPIGLTGDVNPFVYAGANPVGMVDPMGLQAATRQSPLEVATREGLRHLGQSVRRPTRRFPGGQALLIGDVIGVCAAIAWHGVISPPDEDSGDDRCAIYRQRVENAIRRLTIRAREFEADFHQEATRDLGARARHLRSRGEARNQLARAVRQAKYNNCAYNPQADILLAQYAGYNP